MRHEVAIYSASSGWAGFYDRAARREGGAERQMTLLARALAERGRAVAHVTFPVHDPVELTYRVTLVTRPGRKGTRIWDRARDFLSLYRAFVRANADVLVIRSASGALAIAALYCTLHRRRLIFSSSNISDFTLETMSARSAFLFRLGLRRASAVVVQSREQQRLAIRQFQWLVNVVYIPSFAELPDVSSTRTASASEGFLWFGRSAPYKHPLRYVELARAMPHVSFRMIVTWTSEAGSLREQLAEATAEVTNLDIVEPVEHARLLELIQRSVAVVNTSTLEGMPNAFLEAWSCGVPVLTFEFDPDGIVARHDLGVSASGSWTAFVEGACRLWEAKQQRTHVSQHVRSYVRDTHSIGHVGGLWSDLISDVQNRR